MAPQGSTIQCYLCGNTLGFHHGSKRSKQQHSSIVNTTKGKYCLEELFHINGQTLGFHWIRNLEPPYTVLAQAFIWMVTLEFCQWDDEYSLKDSWGAFHYVKNSGKFSWKQNWTVWLDRKMFSKKVPPLKEVHFDQSD